MKRQDIIIGEQETRELGVEYHARLVVLHGTDVVYHSNPVVYHSTAKEYHSNPVVYHERSDEYHGAPVVYHGGVKEIILKKKQ